MIQRLLHKSYSVELSSACRTRACSFGQGERPGFDASFLSCSSSFFHITEAHPAFCNVSQTTPQPSGQAAWKICPQGRMATWLDSSKSSRQHKHVLTTTGLQGLDCPHPHSNQGGIMETGAGPLKTRRATFYLLGAAQSHPGSRARGRPLCRRSSLCRVAAELGTRHLQVAEDLRCPNSSNLLPELFAVQYKLLRHPLSDSTSISLFQESCDPG